MHKVKTDVQKHVGVYIHARMAPFPAMKEQSSTFVFAAYLQCRSISANGYALRTDLRSRAQACLH